MPVYLVHGFRWPRDGYSGIRVHAIVHNLEECSVEYIQNANSREDILGSFRKAYTDIMKDLEAGGRSLEFIEQYDPEDTDSSSAVSQPHAFVADKVVELAGQSVVQQAQKEKSASGSAPLLSANVEEVIADGPGLTPVAWEALADLRDKIAAGEKIGWWVVYNGDPERAYYDSEEDEDEDEGDEEASTPTAELGSTTTGNAASASAKSAQEANPPPVPPKTRTAPLPPDTSTRNFSLGGGAEAAGGAGGSKSVLPNRSKQQPQKLVEPDEVLPPPKNEKIPEPPKLKETVAKSGTGFRKKFFGKKI